MAVPCLKLLLEAITNESLADLDFVVLQGSIDWYAEGGATTAKAFRSLSLDEREDILEYLGEFSLYEEISAGGREYLLVHAGLGNFSPDKPLENYDPIEMLFGCADYGRVYYPDKYVVTGHTPTRNIPGNPNPDRIFRQNNHIAIDCGCGFGGCLAAICLDTDQEFYV